MNAIILTLTEYESSTYNNVWQFITVAFIFVFVLALTAITTRWIAGYKKVQGHNKNIETIEVYRLTNNKWIQILKIGKRYVAVSVGKDEVHMLLELDEEDIQYDLDTTSSNFNLIFDKVLKKKKLMDDMKEELKDD